MAIKYFQNLSPYLIQKGETNYGQKLNNNFVATLAMSNTVDTIISGAPDLILGLPDAYTAITLDGRFVAKVQSGTDGTGNPVYDVYVYNIDNNFVIYIADRKYFAYSLTPLEPLTSFVPQQAQYQQYVSPCNAGDIFFTLISIKAFKKGDSLAIFNFGEQFQDETDLCTDADDSANPVILKADELYDYAILNAPYDADDKPYHVIRLKAVSALGAAIMREL